MPELEFLVGDATAPVGLGNKIIVHVCNDIGGWGKGFVLAISKKWKEPEIEYRKWHASQIEFDLGSVQFVQVESDTWIANLIGQHKIGNGENGDPPIRYGAIELGMAEIHRKAKGINASVHMPRIGCGLAGGKWEEIQPILERQLVNRGIRTTVYDFA